jgi:uncharacterized membrane protein
MKLSKWRYLLLLFVALTSASVAVDCVYRIRMPFRDIAAMALREALLPAIIAAGLFFVYKDRET